MKPSEQYPTSDQPEYWLAAAAAHRSYAERFSISERSRRRHLWQADYCDRRLAETRAALAEPSSPAALSNTKA